MLSFNHFFTPTVIYDHSLCYPKPTLIHVFEQLSDGTSVVTVKDLNSVSDSLASLNYDDFTLQKMLENGVSYKAIQINPDLRIGFDDKINAFNDKLVSIADSLFNLKSVE